MTFMLQEGDGIDDLSGSFQVLRFCDPGIANLQVQSPIEKRRSDTLAIVV